MVKFAYTILYVKDVAKSIDFYEKAYVRDIDGFLIEICTPMS
jgi:catechol 2,3-dioxygenase-like lactoylglutathione lyase family enzyme